MLYARPMSNLLCAVETLPRSPRTSLKTVCKDVASISKKRKHAEICELETFFPKEFLLCYVSRDYETCDGLPDVGIAITGVTWRKDDIHGGILEAIQNYEPDLEAIEYQIVSSTGKGSRRVDTMTGHSSEENCRITYQGYHDAFIFNATRRVQFMIVYYTGTRRKLKNNVQQADDTVEKA